MSGFRINRVYTRSGDNGETALVGGDRVSKSDIRVEAYGEVDELNSQIGVVKEHLPEKLVELRPVLDLIQQELFDIGAELACEQEELRNQLLSVEAANIQRLEEYCDFYNEDLEELQSFIVPGGSRIASLLHVARCVCRRAERGVVRLCIERSCDPDIQRYLNRLSDLLFILARWSLKAEGATPGVWIEPDKRLIP